jgi:hypothetical protein
VAADLVAEEAVVDFVEVAAVAVAAVVEAVAGAEAEEGE